MLSISWALECWWHHSEILNKMGSFHSDPLSLGSPWAPAPRVCCWMAFEYWLPGLRSLVCLNGGRTGFPHLFWYTWTIHTHNALQSSPKRRSSSSTLYIVFPLCPSDFQSLLLTWRNDFQPFLKVSSLSLICSLSSICQVSYHHEWTGSQHTKKKTMLVCLTKIWKLAPNLSVHSTPFLLLMIPFSFPQQSVTLLISLTVVIVTKILYLEKK